MKILVVESPAKSKTIGRYLGKDYVVVPSFGHVRDLPSKNGSVDPENGFSMVWENSKTGVRCINELSRQLKNADELLLATDPDREGEAISWHIVDCLKDKLGKSKTVVKRVAFHEITKKAILGAIANPREIDQNLVDAYLARRALDYLFGFSLSPILWTKLPGCRSAGRVQSVALRILTDREDEIDSFISQEYWSVTSHCSNEKSKKFDAKLNVLNGEKLSKLALKSEEDANRAKEIIKSSDFFVSNIDKKDIRKNPAPPFITSTLQQEASRKLNFSAKKTMQIAQMLYEGVDINGETKALITYMRTDSLNLSQDFIDKTRNFLEKEYGQEFLPSKQNNYKNKVKNAQEAHEAIRPINIELTPDQLEGYLDENLLSLYSLIWKRTLASQMTQAVYNQVQVDIATEDKNQVLRVTGTTLLFEGYLKVYEEGKDVQEESDDQKLPIFSIGERIIIDDVSCDQHFTQPPARYTEASLVKKMEELGIGRPSTYATIIQVLQERKYATIRKKVFYPELRGRIVISFLTSYFPKYLKYDFTAMMEEDLDEISNAYKSKDSVLEEFWRPFNESVLDVKKISMKQVIDSLNTHMEKVFFGVNSSDENHKCPQCGEGTLVLKLWTTGAFLGCSRYPDCNYKRHLTSSTEDNLEGGKPISDYPKYLGKFIGTDNDIYIKSGPYGFYLELDSDVKKRTAIPNKIDINNITIEIAAFLLSLPKTIGSIDGNDVVIGVGKYGPYILYNKKYTSIKDFNDFLDMSLDRAKEILNL